MILAIETSDILCAVAFWKDGKTLLEYNFELPRQHAALLGDLVNKGLESLSANKHSQKYTIEDLRLVAVSIGPGSFTGLRIGLSFAQGLCFGKNKPIVGISNHQVLASQRSDKKSPLFTLIEARRNEVYFAEHEIISKKYTVLKNHKIVQKTAIQDWIPAGSQLVYKMDLNFDETVKAALLRKNICIIANARYSASLLAGLGNEKNNRDGADDLAGLEPMYIRPFAGVL